MSLSLCCRLLQSTFVWLVTRIASHHLIPLYLSLKTRRTPSHHLALTHQLRAELAAVQRQIDVEIYPVERPVRRVHPLKVLFEVFPRQVGCKRDHFFDACRIAKILATRQKKGGKYTYVDLSRIQDTHPRHTHTECPRTSGSPPARPAGKS